VEPAFAKLGKALVPKENPLIVLDVEPNRGVIDGVPEQVDAW
jgi:hypothetical protein